MLVLPYCIKIAKILHPDLVHEVVPSKPKGSNIFPLATGVIDAICAILSCECLREFSKQFEMVLVVGKSGAEGNMMHEKTRSRKSREMVPLKVSFEDQPPLFGMSVKLSFIYL